MTDHRVGPAPATPDEGAATTIARLEAHCKGREAALHILSDQYVEARAALATAEAERDATAKIADDALEILDRLAAFGLHPEKQGDLYEKVAALRRALSVEADE